MPNTGIVGGQSLSVGSEYTLTRLPFPAIKEIFVTFSLISNHNIIALGLIYLNFTTPKASG
jgi:hypothetical protein